jgi:DNA repair protein RecN (Recombination protein N)
MLHFIRLTNIVLIEHAEIAFKNGFNIISGETGAGKSILMGALHLITGQRADTSLIRHGADKAIIEAAFDITPDIYDILIAAGIPHEKSDYLIIKREILPSGKNRSFVNNHMVQLPLLKKIGPRLLNIVQQHGSYSLKKASYHRDVVDMFGTLHKQTKDISTSWEEILTLRKRLQELLTTESQRLRDIEMYNHEIKEIEEAAIREHEEEEIEAEYNRLIHAEELAEMTSQLYHLLSNTENAIVPQITTATSLSCKLVEIDPSLKESYDTLEHLRIEVQEVAYSIQAYNSSINRDPYRLTFLEERLTILTKLKRKYGATEKDILAYYDTVHDKLSKLHSVDTTIEDLKALIKEKEDKIDAICHALTLLREKAASRLEKALTKHLRDLNMPKAEFSIRLSKEKRSCHGDDGIEFFFTPNAGEKCIPIRECASGGELSRILLAINTTMAGLHVIPTLIFDEIDSNIGGTTATMVGEKLHLMGETHQIICITHLPQIASKGDHHLKIAKTYKKKRTVTTISQLEEDARRDELMRMAGVE